MATAARLTLDATTPQLAASGTDSDGTTVVLFPQAAGTILFGPSNETTANGARKAVAAGDAITLVVPNGESVYLLCATSTLAVDVLRFG